MLRLSATTVVILAAVCFTGLVVLQIAWISSAYQGELALFNKAKRQFESELQMQLKQDESFTKSLKQLLDRYNNGETVSPAEQSIFTNHFKSVVKNISKEKQFSLYPAGINIIRHKHSDSIESQAPLLLNNAAVSAKQIRNASKLCIHCMLGLDEDGREAYNYQLLVLYEKDAGSIYKKMGLLIVVSFLLLLFLGILFRYILKKYRQEQKLSEAKNDFINNLSHELQTPVFAVQIANRLIREKTNNDEMLQPFLGIIERETQQLKLHAAKILELASLENEQVELRMEIRDLNAFLNEKKPTLELMVQDKGGNLLINQAPEELLTLLDPVHFNNVLVSLAENAIKYTNGKPELLLHTGRKGKMVSISLTDHGIGIEEQYLPFLFDKFYRVPTGNSNGCTGFGLGLSYAQQIVTLHKGQIQVKSEVGKGTTVTIQLPMLQHA